MDYLNKALLGYNLVFNEQTKGLGVFDSILEPIKKSFGNPQDLTELHKNLPFEEIKKANVIANESIKESFSDITKKIVKSLGYKKHFYINHTPVIRYFPPFDFINRHEKSEEHKNGLCCVGIKAGNGRVRYHGPHRDCWYDSSTNTVNIWIAITDIEPGNGMVIYPESLNKDIERRGVEALTNGSFGKPEFFPMKAGSLLLFNANHIHTTELNTTDKTRVSLTLRVSLDKPTFLSTEGKNPIYYDSRFVNTPLKKIMTEPNLCSRLLTGKIKLLR